MKITKLLVVMLLLAVSSLCFYGCEGEPEPEEPQMDEFQIILTNAEWGLNYACPKIKTRGVGYARVDEEFVFDYDGKEHFIGGYVLRNGENTWVRAYCGSMYIFGTGKMVFGGFKERGKFRCIFSTDYLKDTEGYPIAISMYINIVIQ